MIVGIFVLIAAAVAAASQPTFTHIHVFQPERATINGLGPNTDTLQLSVANGGYLGSTVSLHIDMAWRLASTMTANGVFLLYRGGRPIYPVRLDGGNHDPLPSIRSRGFDTSPIRLQRNDVVVVVLPHTSHVRITQGEMRDIFRNVDSDSCRQKTEYFASRLRGEGVTVLTAVVKELGRDPIPASYTTIKFDQPIPPPMPHQPLFVSNDFEDRGFRHQPLFVSNDYEQQGPPPISPRDVYSPGQRHEPSYHQPIARQPPIGESMRPRSRRNVERHYHHYQ